MQRAIATALMLCAVGCAAEKIQPTRVDICDGMPHRFGDVTIKLDIPRVEIVDGEQWLQVTGRVMNDSVGSIIPMINEMRLSDKFGNQIDIEEHSLVLSGVPANPGISTPFLVKAKAPIQDAGWIITASLNTEKLGDGSYVQDVASGSFSP